MSIDLTQERAFELRAEVEELFYREADLLDERRFTEWLQLLSEDVRYRVPIAENVHSGDVEREYVTGPLDIYWMDEGLETLTARVQQLLTGIHWAEEPVSRTSHLVTNVRLLDVGEDEGRPSVRVRSRVLVYRNRLAGEEDLLVGKREDTLVRIDSALKIRERIVYLDHRTLLANNLATFL